MAPASSDWAAGPARPRVAPAEVHVWLAGLAPDDQTLARLGRTLSPDELDRARRFHFERDRRRFIAARGVLRDILGRYLQLDPAVLTFEYSEYGKPSLPPRIGGHLRFNLSHSHELAVYAVGLDRELGVDIEYLHPTLTTEIADRYFSPSEVEALKSVPESLQRQAFLNCWTRKEAYIKAHGQGLSLALDSFDVSLRPGEPAALLAARHSEGEAERWSLQALSCAPEYVAALAAEGHGWDCVLWRWSAHSTS